jgi:SnoaL-like domain
MSDVNDTVAGYFAAWNETDPARRRERIAAAWAPEANYVDPMFTASGYEALEGLVAAVHQQYPGYRFRLVGDVDHHHDRLRWGWVLANEQAGSTLAEGFDVAVLAVDGRLSDVTGFFTMVAAPAANGGTATSQAGANPA